MAEGSVVVRTIIQKVVFVRVGRTIIIKPQICGKHSAVLSTRSRPEMRFSVSGAEGRSRPKKAGPKNKIDLMNQNNYSKEHSYCGLLFRSF